MLGEPTTGLMAVGNTVIVVKHGMPVVVQSDWVINVGPGAGADGGQIVAAGTPQDVTKSKFSKTAPILPQYLFP